MKRAPHPILLPCLLSHDSSKSSANPSFGALPSSGPGALGCLRGGGAIGFEPTMASANVGRSLSARRVLTFKLTDRARRQARDAAARKPNIF